MNLAKARRHGTHLQRSMNYQLSDQNPLPLLQCGRRGADQHIVKTRRRKFLKSFGWLKSMVVWPSSINKWFSLGFADYNTADLQLIAKHEKLQEIYNENKLIKAPTAEYSKV